MQISGAQDRPAPMPLVRDEEATRAMRAHALDKACRSFEAIFIKQILAGAHSGERRDGLSDTNVASDIVWGMHDTHMAESMSQSQGIGIARMLYEELSRQLDRASAGAPPNADSAGGQGS